MLWQERWEENGKEEGECLHAGSMEETTEEHNRAPAMELCVRKCAASEEPKGMRVNVWKADKAQNESSEGTLGDKLRAKRDRNHKQCVP